MYKDTIKTELVNSIRLKGEIQSIVQKYKKLILDQKKEKEKMQGLVV